MLTSQYWKLGMGLVYLEQIAWLVAFIRYLCTPKILCNVYWVLIVTLCACILAVPWQRKGPELLQLSLWSSWQPEEDEEANRRWPMPGVCRPVLWLPARVKTRWTRDGERGSAAAGYTKDDIIHCGPRPPGGIWHIPIGNQPHRPPEEVFW